MPAYEEGGDEGSADKILEKNLNTYLLTKLVIQVVGSGRGKREEIYEDVIESLRLTGITPEYVKPNNPSSDEKALAEDVSGGDCANGSGNSLNAASSWTSAEQAKPQSSHMEGEALLSEDPGAILPAESTVRYGLRPRSGPGSPIQCSLEARAASLEENALHRVDEILAVLVTTGDLVAETSDATTQYRFPPPSYLNTLDSALKTHNSLSESVSRKRELLRELISQGISLSQLIRRNKNSEQNCVGESTDDVYLQLQRQSQLASAREATNDITATSQQIPTLPPLYYLSPSASSSGDATPARSPQLPIPFLLLCAPPGASGSIETGGQHISITLDTPYTIKDSAEIIDSLENNSPMPYRKIREECPFELQRFLLWPTFECPVDVDGELTAAASPVDDDVLAESLRGTPWRNLIPDNFFGGAGGEDSAPPTVESEVEYLRVLAAQAQSAYLEALRDRELYLMSLEQAKADNLVDFNGGTKFNDKTLYTEGVNLGFAVDNGGGGSLKRAKSSLEPRGNGEETIDLDERSEKMTSGSLVTPSTMASESSSKIDRAADSQGDGYFQSKGYGLRDRKAQDWSSLVKPRARKNPFEKQSKRRGILDDSGLNISMPPSSPTPIPPQASIDSPSPLPAQFFLSTRVVSTIYSKFAKGSAREIACRLALLGCWPRGGSCKASQQFLNPPHAVPHRLPPPLSHLVPIPGLPNGCERQILLGLLGFALKKLGGLVAENGSPAVLKETLLAVLEEAPTVAIIYGLEDVKDDSWKVLCHFAARILECQAGVLGGEPWIQKAAKLREEARASLKAQHEIELVRCLLPSLSLAP